MNNMSDMSNASIKVREILVPLFCFLLFIGTGQSVGVTEKKLDEAYRLLKTGNDEAAVRLFESHLETHADDARIHLETAYVYIKMKQDHSALPHLLKHLELVPPKPEILLETAYTYLRTKQLPQAETFFTRYLEARPRDFGVHGDLAFLQLKTGKKKEAVRRMNLILEQEPGQETIRLNLAYLLMEKQPEEAYRHFRILAQSDDPETRQRVQTVLKNKPSNIGYFIYAVLYHSFRFDINVLDINSRVYLKDTPVAPLEPYFFLTLSTDAESRLNPFPTIYSEQAAVVGAGVQWYFLRRNARLFVQYGYRTRFLKPPLVENKKGSLSFGLESFFYHPLENKWGLELYNVLVYHSRFDNDLLFEGKETVTRMYHLGKYGFFKPYAGILGRWDTQKYFYNNGIEFLAGLRWSWRGDFTYFLFCEYKWGNYFNDTPYGRSYNEWQVGIVVGIYR